jgi:hypothetical protein
MRNTLTIPIPGSRRAAATHTREVLNDNAARSLPELTPRQKAGAKLLGGRAIEKFTREQLKEGTERSLRDIESLFGKDPSSESGNFHITNQLTLGRISANAGLPSTQVRLHEVAKPSSHSVITFFSPSESELPATMRTLLEDPAFKVTEEGVSVSLRSKLEPIPRPYEALSRQEQMLAYFYYHGCS